MVTATTEVRDKNATASVCKSARNGLTNLTTSIENCTSVPEETRNNNLAQNILKLQEDIISLRSTTSNALTMGGTMFGEAGYNVIAEQVRERNNDIRKKKEDLVKDIEKGEAIITRTNQDFTDVRNTVPEPQPQKTLRFIEDYTLAILAISYIFMIIACIYIFTITSEFKLVAFGKAFVGSTLLSMFLFIFLFYIT